MAEVGPVNNDAITIGGIQAIFMSYVFLRKVLGPAVDQQLKVIEGEFAFYEK